MDKNKIIAFIEQILNASNLSTATPPTPEEISELARAQWKGQTIYQELTGKEFRYKIVD